jgi:hypothetical protein
MRRWPARAIRLKAVRWRESPCWPTPIEDAAITDSVCRAVLDEEYADLNVRDGKIQEFNCHIGTTTMFAQLGVLSDFTSAVAASAPAR